MGGAGGNITNVTARSTSFSESLIFAGTPVPAADANGATGGNVNGVKFENDGPIDQVLIAPGSGSGLLGGNGNGGNSGSLSNVIVNSFADADDIFIERGRHLGPPRLGKWRQGRCSLQCHDQQLWPFRLYSG